ncbi:MAG: Rib/alpha-like domain-containing protein [Tissierellia bacterium]|nr:Rib/alpha-like domain-containing protein [Tissierellia bacterium]
MTITEDIIPVSDPSNPPVKPEGYITVTFDETVNGTLPDGTTKVFYVAPDRVVSLNIIDPTRNNDGTIEYIFNEWDHALKAQFKNDTLITALYNMKWMDIKPIPGLKADQIITNIGVEPTEKQYRDVITADGNPLSDDATLEIVQPDVSTPGDKEAKVTIKFPDGSTSVIAVSVKVLKDVYPSWDAERPEYAPEDYVKVRLEPTDKGYYNNGPKTFFVRLGVEVKIPANDAKGIVLDGIEYIFTGCDKSLVNTFNQNTVIKA